MTALIPPHSEDRFAEVLLGDTVALDELLRAHRPAVEAVCFRRLRSRTDAEDAVQETMLRGIRSLHHVEDPTRLRSYLCRIAERVCLDMLRAGAKAMPAEVETMVQPAEERLEPENQALEQERARLVHQTLRALSDRDAHALWMRDAMGEPVPKVAASLGVTEGSARVLLTRARAKMRDGWAKVAAIIPGAGFKVPVLTAKAVHLGPLAIPIIPAVAVMIAVAASPVALQAINGESGVVISPDERFSQPIALPEVEPVTVTTTISDRSVPAAGAGGVTQTAPGVDGVHSADATGDPAASISIVEQQLNAGRRPANPENDDVTVGPDDLLQVGASIEEAAETLGVRSPDVELDNP